MLKLISVFILSLVLSNSAFADGWKVGTIEGKRVTSISNIGDQGGFLSLSCNLETKQLTLQYLFEDKEYDMFLVRNFGDTDMEGGQLKVLIGGGTGTQNDLITAIMNNDRAFSIARFDIGGKDVLNAAVKRRDKTAPVINQLGEEYFLAGNDVKALINNLAASCPYDPSNHKVIF